MKLILAVLTYLLVFQISSNSQTNDDCLMCHSDPEMTMEKGRKKISLWLDNSKFIFSAHKKLNCISCHKGFNPDDIPHKAKIEPVDCKSCHKGVEKKHTFHPWMSNAPLQDNCKNCHGYHDVSAVKSKNSNLSGVNAINNCGTCHTEIKNEYIKSEHFKALQNINSENAPDCNYCHKHQITEGWITDYKTRKNNQNDVCIHCHNTNTDNPDVIKKVSNEHSRHAGLRIKGKEHAAVCTDCHGFHNIRKNEDTEARLNPKNSFSYCGKCHVHIAQEYQNSIHGTAQLKGNTNAAGCTSCHFEHGGKNLQITDEVYKNNFLSKEFSEKSGIVNCISCHTDESNFEKNKFITLTDAHDWLPRLKEHFASVSCYDCHSSYTEPYLSHNILPLNKSVKDCQGCHSKSVELKSILFNYQKNESVSQSGIIKGNTKGNSNYIGITKNIILDYLSLIFLGLLVTGILIHSYVRWYFNKAKVKK